MQNPRGLASAKETFCLKWLSENELKSDPNANAFTITYVFFPMRALEFNRKDVVGHCVAMASVQAQRSAGV